ncbi:hypothetical protein [Merismopedia glauca]|uniref:hypothetical protein n=1 Tax=Merismopedia glauca TaxID=292586 RepID=UPI0015E72544|nr:hypothetical protein [Merismopedia glauca]
MDRKAEIDNVQEPIISATPEVRQIIERVWQIEKSRLDRKILSHINEDILKVIKEVIQ